MSREFGSVELEYTYTLNDVHAILLRTDIEGVAQFAPAGGELRTVSIRFGTKTVSDNNYSIVSLILSNQSNSETVDISDFNLGSVGLETLRVRIFIFNQYISVYCNNLWVFSHALRQVQYPRAAVTCTLVYEGGAGYIVDIMRRELADGREAIWIDYEATGDNTIQSVIQQRPVEIFPRSGRAVAFSYNVLDRDEVTADWVNNYTSTVEDNSQMSSDGLVYYRDVGVSMHSETAKEVGLITRLYRLSELDNGAVEATRIYQDKALERRHKGQYRSRLDPQLEPGDKAIIDYILTGTGTHVTKNIIVENISISLQDGLYSMIIDGREEL